MAHVGQVEKHKRKRKENFLRQTKRHGKKGNFGKGKRLSEDEYNYFMRVFEQLKHVDGEDKDILVRNFFREIERDGQEKRLASNQIVSRILDDALPLADVTQVLALSRVLGEDLRPMCVDPYASHVLQTLLTLSLKYWQEDAVQKRSKKPDEEDKNGEEVIKITDEQRGEFFTFMNKVGRFVYNNLEQFVCDPYASHIIRTVLEVCSGVEVRDSVKSSQRSQTSHALLKDAKTLLTVPPKLKQLLLDMVVRFTRLPEFPEIIINSCGSAVLQSLLLVLSDVEEEHCKTIVTHILLHGFPGVTAWSDPEEESSVQLPHIFQDNPTIHLLEGVVTCCSSEQQSEVFQQYFKGNMITLVRHPLANFAIQRLLSSWKEKDTFTELYDEVCETLEAAAEAKHMGVIHALAKACHRLDSNQSKCMQALMKLLGCWEPERLQMQLVSLLLWMLPYEVYQTQHSQGKLPSVSLHGTLIIQELLHFRKPIKVVNSLLEMNVANLQLMACDPRGSHVIDAFTLSSFVGSKSRDKLIHRLKGTYSSLACSKHGSRSLEALWKVASIKLKTQICNELLLDELKLKGSQFGIIIYTNFQVGMFKRGDRSDWQQLIEKTEKKRKMFNDLLNGEDADMPKKKKKKKKDKEKEGKSDNFGDDIFIDTSGNISD